MISVIICSVDAQAAENLRQNIAETIGVPHEVLVFDNRATACGIGKVYNLCARDARYELLCFAHEDIRFDTPDWGPVLAGKLREEDCGVIGFAGSVARTSAPSGWRINRQYTRLHYIQHQRDGKHPKIYNPQGERFSQVITLDGLCLSVRKAVWEEVRFDERTFPGFHAYDMDFTTAVALKYRNYVCNEVFAEHFSSGAYTPAWIESMQTYREKWQDRLPLYVDPPSEKQQRRDEIQTQYAFIKLLMQKRVYPWSRLGPMVAGHLRLHPASGAALALNYLKYRCKYAFKGAAH